MAGRTPARKAALGARIARARCRRFLHSCARHTSTASRTSPAMQTRIIAMTRLGRMSFRWDGAALGVSAGGSGGACSGNGGTAVELSYMLLSAMREQD